MREALYRKYRSKSLSEIVGQEHITDTLHRAVESGKISHAYLFTGPRGVGKTSIARILAHQINGIPYTEHESQHLDIIEIDAASNRRIDEIRDLKERVHIAPAQYKFKVYIIDEVHMLTKEAFNALLKTLEEPPAHAVFILATTELHKLPETIVSRTQRFGFKPIPTSQVIERLQDIAKQENVQIDTEALELIARHGDGSFRDSISLLDQVQHIADEITAEHVRTTLGLAPTELIERLVGGLLAHKPNEIRDQLQIIRENGIQPKPVASQLTDSLLVQLPDAKQNKTQLITLLRALTEVPSHRDPLTSLELSLYDYVLTETPTTTPDMDTDIKPTQSVAPAVSKRPAKSKTQPVESKESQKIIETVATEVAPPMNMTDNILSSEIWESVLTEMKRTYNTLYGVVRMAKPALVESQLILEFSFPFHQKRLKEQKNQQILITIFKQQTGTVVTINPIIKKNTESVPQSVTNKPKNPPEEHIKNVSNIFGGAEIVES